ncbi:MAG: methionyl-tRNA formyltransferase [Gammaproteobacteria bacterium RIFCSPHIGHO2_12_FULL_41_15]|nr:MAG: methionyl-tRNA formyltransferase [Gammaproteobacteria bacterium RIFCSPHIGHO2_12_FULL_41_15]
MPFRIVFAGTPSFAVPCLQGLLESDHTVVAVYTQPDRPAGRGQILQASPVKQVAVAQGIPVQQPLTWRDEAVQRAFAEWRADMLVVAAYGLLLPQVVLSIPRLGCINVHASLLPRWRGAAPIQRAIWAGDEKTGVTIMQMDAGLDTGDILLQKTCAIEPEDTSQTLHDRLALLGASALMQTLGALTQSHIHPIPQEGRLATYAPKITKIEAQLNWHQPAVLLARQIRACNPAPIAYTRWNQLNLRVWQARAVDRPVSAAPGTIIKADQQGLEVATAQGILQLLVLQLPGARPISAKDFLNAHHDALIVGNTRLG